MISLVPPRIRTACCLLSLALLATASTVPAEELDFGRDIRPILSDKCFQCHGADEESRGGSLRLDLSETALAGGDSGAVIVPGRPEESELIRRIRSHDEGERMPPADSTKSLTAEQMDKLEQWIREGAVYSGHWAFEPVRQPQLPAVRQQDWVRNEIDAFVLSRLEAENLSPSPEADRATLIRRLYQDLLGLLPSPEELQQFIHDDRPEAYQELVDRLLENPHYGERWGRHWLDQARYADSHGFTIDGPRIMWPYRDWVIQALNRDMPFDQFTIEQLAGDLLEKPTKSQLVAAGFHRNTLINQEGGVKPDQYRHEAILDRVNTTGAVWLGLTVGCAQCHTHKFDPILHSEYYQLYSFFNACEDANNVGPSVSVYRNEMFGFSDEQYRAMEELEQLTRKIKQLENGPENGPEHLRNANWDWKQVDVTDTLVEGNGTFQRLPDGSLLSDGSGLPNATYRISLRSASPRVTAFRLRLLTDPSLPKNGPGLASNGNFVLTDLELSVDGETIRFEEAWADHSQDNYPVANAIDDDKKSGWAINIDAKQVKNNPNLKLNQPREASFLLPRPLDLGDGIVTLVLKHGANSGYRIGRVAIDTSAQTPPQNNQPATENLARMRERRAELQAMIGSEGESVRQMVMRDMASPPDTYRLERGDFLTPDTGSGALSPGVPAALLVSTDSPPSFSSRLDLANWLVDPENPLTSRVTVNRVWMRYFGRGLVETENDFGFQGSPPTHPQLLDWLSWEFMQRGWSLKSLHRLIVNSATYRQSSDSRADLATKDPYNYLLARQSRFRVEAEIVRDLALSASGLLTPTIGGPSVHPPQPDGVYSFTQTKKSWPESQGPDRYRRTLYTMLYRSAPYPLMGTFDAPDFSTVCTSRPRSDTPLQSLTLANDPMFIELSQGLAARTIHESTESAVPARLQRMFQLCLSRSAAPDELALLENYWNAEVQRYQNDAEAAPKVAFKEDGLKIPVAERAAWSNVARVLLNTDEFVTRN